MLNANSARFRKHRVRELLTGAPPDGTAGTAVDHVRVTLSGGQSLRVPAVRAGGPRFFAFAIPKGARLVRVDFYTASRRLVARQLASQL